MTTNDAIVVAPAAEVSAVKARVHGLVNGSRRVKPAAKPEPEVHPLARFVDLSATPAPPRMVIPGFIQSGVVVIAGAHGAGKTTVLVPLAMLVAGLHRADDPLAPKHWRHVVYIAEDEAQVRRILSGVVGHAGVAASAATLRERFHVVPAMRMPPDQVAEVAPIYRAQFTRQVGDVALPPLVVIDTKAATVEVADENSNAEAGALVALFKQRFEGLPLWLVGHVAKALTTRKDVQGLSARGASAIEADAHQTLFLVVEGEEGTGQRFLVLGKRRFEPRWTELEVQSGTADTSAVDEFGEAQPLTLRWGLPTPPTQSRAAAREEARQREVEEATTALRSAILDAVDAAWMEGRPLSARELRDAVKGRTEAVRAVAARLERESWLVSVEVPRADRTNASRSAFLVRLDDNERRALLAGRGLPANKAVIPASWKRPDAVVPAREPAATFEGVQ